MNIKAAVQAAVAFLFVVNHCCWVNAGEKAAAK
jgi:hypothetical protein